MIDANSASIPVLTPGRMALFAATAGVMVANLYYSQPLLADIGRSFGCDATQAGYLVTVVQLGYALGVLLLVPLGDRLDRRRLTSFMLAACVVGLLCAAASPTLVALGAASLLVGAAASATMVVVPYVASHAPEATRGRAIGQVMTGLLLGILLARTVSGAVADWAGWRWVYVLAAAAVGALWFALRRAMAPDPPREAVPYGTLLASLVTLVRNEPELRRRAFYALLGLGAFSALWKSLTFLLTAAPYRYSTTTVGLFGLIGAAGALSANLAGRLGDRGLARPMTGAFAAMLLVAWIVLAQATTSLAMVIVGVFLVDAAAQGLQVTHQSVIYRLAPKARSRITAVFITAGFVGMSLGSALASASYRHAQWRGVCAIGAGLSALLLASWLVGRLRDARKASTGAAAAAPRAPSARRGA